MNEIKGEICININNEFFMLTLKTSHVDENGSTARPTSKSATANETANEMFMNKLYQLLLNN